jgi:hypothetical protein
MRIDVFLNDEVSVVALDHVFDLEDFVTGENAKSVRVEAQASVFGEGHSHDRHAAGIRAFADQVVRRVPVAIELDDSLVDITEQDFVSRKAFFATGHTYYLPWGRAI